MIHRILSPNWYLNTTRKTPAYRTLSETRCIAFSPSLVDKLWVGPGPEKMPGLEHMPLLPNGQFSLIKDTHGDLVITSDPDKTDDCLLFANVSATCENGTSMSLDDVSPKCIPRLGVFVEPVSDGQSLEVIARMKRNSCLCFNLRSCGMRTIVLYEWNGVRIRKLIFQYKNWANIYGIPEIPDLPQIR